MSVGDMRHDPRLGLSQRFEHRGHQGPKHRDIVARGVNDDDSDRWTGEVLPILQVAIDSQENVESRCCELEQRAVLESSSTRIGEQVRFRLLERGQRDFPAHAHKIGARRVALGSHARQAGTRC